MTSEVTEDISSGECVTSTGHAKDQSEVEVIVTWNGHPRGSSGDDSRGGRCDLRVGERLEFGISGRHGLFQPGATPSIGAFEASSNHLLLSNLTTCSTFVIENLEGGTELIKARPRRLNLVIPFEMSRILIPSTSGIVELAVFTQPSVMLPEHAVRVPDSEMFQLDTESKYFAVLVALCEPRLRGSSMAAVPSVQEAVDRLRSTDQFKGANRSSINYHIEYLADQKIPVTRWAKYVDGGRMHSKREALVAFALRFDLVREEHLSLLESRRCRRTSHRVAT